MRWLKKKVGVFYASLLLDKTASAKLMFRVGTVEVALDHHVRLKSKIYHSHCKSALTTAEAVKILPCTNSAYFLIQMDASAPCHDRGWASLQVLCPPELADSLTNTSAVRSTAAAVSVPGHWWGWTYHVETTSVDQVKGLTHQSSGRRPHHLDSSNEFL